MSTDHESLPEILSKVSLGEDEDHILKDKEAGRIEGKDGLVPLDPVKMNKTLEHEYMMKYEPFDDLPSTYFPRPKYNHRPHYWVFGFGFPLIDLMEFAFEMKISPSPEEAGEDSPTIWNAWFEAAVYLTKRARTKFGVSMYICSVRSKEAQVVLRLWDNYCDDLPSPGEEAIFEAIYDLQDVLEKGGIETYPKWYLSEQELDSRDFGFPIDFTQIFPPVTSPESSVAAV